MKKLSQQITGILLMYEEQAFGHYRVLSSYFALNSDRMVSSHRNKIMTLCKN